MKFPIGYVVNLPAKGIPEGWLLCDGKAVSREEHKELFWVIGTLYGEGDGETTFNLPCFGQSIINAHDKETAIGEDVVKFPEFDENKLDLIIHFVGGSKKRIADVTEEHRGKILDSIFEGRPTTELETARGTVEIVNANITWIETRLVEV